jgi:ATP-dependent Clp protease ATP-binding subunit ClpA
VFERFTEPARQVVVFAQDEARKLKHNYIGTEHLLLGLLREEEGMAARVLESLGVGLEDARAELGRIVGAGDEVTPGLIPFTPRAKRVLEAALREALTLGHNHIGTEHVLLGLTREADGVAMQILLELDADAEKIRSETVRLVSGLVSYSVQPVELHPDLRAEIERVPAEIEAAPEAEDFERAAAWRARQRNLVRLARQGDHGAFWEEARRPVGIDVRVGSPTVASLAGGAMFGVALGLGILIGRLVWG